MAKGIKTGGRQKGTPNKDTQDLFAICEKHGVSVFESLVMLTAAEEDKDRKFSKLLELAPYLYAKRKDLNVAIDPDANEIRIRVIDYGKNGS